MYKARFFRLEGIGARHALLRPRSHRNTRLTLREKTDCQQCSDITDLPGAKLYTVIRSSAHLFKYPQKGFDN